MIGFLLLACLSSEPQSQPKNQPISVKKGDKSLPPQAVFVPELRGIMSEIVGANDGAHQRLEGYTKRHKDDSFALMMLAWSHRQRNALEQERATRGRIPAHRRGAYDFFIDREPEHQLRLINAYLSDSCHQNRLPNCPEMSETPPDYPAFEQLAWASHRENRIETWLQQPTQLRAKDVGRRIGIVTGMKVADVGAGEGWFTVPFAELVGKDGVVYGVEIDLSYVRLLDHVAAVSQLPQLKTIHSSASSAELPAGQLDMVFVCEVMKAVVTDAQLVSTPEHYALQALPFVQSLVSGLRVGGKLVWIEHKMAPGKLGGTSLALLKRLATETGLEITEVSDEYGPLQVMVIATKRTQ